MKNKRLLDAFGLAEERYVAEADPTLSRRKMSKLLRWGIVAACFCLVVVSFNLWLFLPLSNKPDDMSEYAGSEYYDVIVKLGAMNASTVTYKNNFEKYLGDIWGGSKKESSTDGFDYIVDNDAALGGDMMNGSASDGNASAPGDPGDSGESYEEITDNQVSGVVEADRIKRSDKYIYYLDGKTLRVFSIEGKGSREVGNYLLNTTEYTNTVEFYLSEDCKTVTVIFPRYGVDSATCVELISLDVSDPENIVETGRISVMGEYLSSRLTGGEMLLLTNFNVKKNPDFSDESQFVPQYDCGEGMTSVPAANIIAPDKLDYSRYTVVYKLDCESLDVVGSAAFLSYSQAAYVSEESVYVTRTFNETRNGDAKYSLNCSMTEIRALSYKNGFEHKGAVSVDGYVKDQYSLDEYEGILRVVTTTSATQMRDYGDYTAALSSRTNADLYCIDLASMTVKAKVISFAPTGETVQSVRFDKNAAYVCTSVVLTDPVFFFDLTDLENITYKDTGTISGFSSSLVQLGDGYLLGIGQGESWDSFKIEIYEETETGVASVCKYELKNAYYSTNYKSYYINRDKDMIGLGIQTDTSRYLVVYFDGYELRELIFTELAGQNEFKRGVYIDGYFYMFGYKDFKVMSIG